MKFIPFRWLKDNLYNSYDKDVIKFNPSECCGAAYLKDREPYDYENYGITIYFSNISVEDNTNEWYTNSVELKSGGFICFKHNKRPENKDDDVEVPHE